MSTASLFDYKYWSEISTVHARKVADVFQNKGYEIRVVGGAVRDVIQDKPPKDIDMATNATPQQIVDLCVEADIKHIMTGFQHGTVTLMIEDTPFEVTTLRVDTETDGRHALVQYTTDFQLDAARRDLTINAMSVDIMSGKLYDYYEGFDHLIKRKVVFVGDPQERIQEDYLRILRYFRFYGRIAKSGNEFDVPTINAIMAHKEGLRQISRERIWLEMQRIIVGNFATELLLKMKSLDIFPLINLDHFKLNIDRFDKVLNTAVHLDEIRPVTMLSYLCETGEDFAKLRKCWKMSSDEEYIGQFCIKHRTKHELKYFKDLLVDTAKHCRHKFLMGFKELCYSRDQGADDLYSAVVSWIVPVCPIRGDEVIKCLDLPKGPLVSKYFTKGKSKWKDSGYTLSKEELLDYLKSDMKKL